MLLEVIAPLTSPECLCCSSTMHSEQTVVEVYIVGPWVFLFCVKDPNFVTSHVHFVLRITLEVWNARHSSQHDNLETEINIQMEMVDVSSCIVRVESSVEAVFIRSDENWWWRRAEQWVKCWHGKRMTYFHTRRASGKKPSLLWHWRKIKVCQLSLIE